MRDSQGINDFLLIQKHALNLLLEDESPELKWPARVSEDQLKLLIKLGKNFLSLKDTVLEDLNIFIIIELGLKGFICVN